VPAPDLEQFMARFGDAMEADIDTAVRSAGRFIRDQIAFSLEADSGEIEDGDGPRHDDEAVAAPAEGPN
jgi:hypothetical protein